MKNLKKFCFGIAVILTPMISIAGGGSTNPSSEDLFKLVESIESFDQFGCCDQWCNAQVGTDPWGNPIFQTWCCKPCAVT